MGETMATQVLSTEVPVDTPEAMGTGIITTMEIGTGMVGTAGASLLLFLPMASLFLLCRQAIQRLWLAVTHISMVMVCISDKQPRGVLLWLLLTNMVQELPIRNPPIFPFRFKRYFESKNNEIRIFGPCEVTGKNFEIHVPVEGFFVYLQGFKTMAEALSAAPEEAREFILTGVSPEGRKLRVNGQ